MRRPSVKMYDCQPAQKSLMCMMEAKKLIAGLAQERKKVLVVETFGRRQV